MPTKYSSVVFVFNKYCLCIMKTFVIHRYNKETRFDNVSYNVQTKIRCFDRN